MARGPSVLLLDDGELDDVQAVLEEQGVSFARVRGGAIVEGTPPPTDLLVATPRRIDAVTQVSGPADPNGPVRLVVVNEDSNQLRNQLRSRGFDFMVRRPVHPEALRLLVMRCLYRGEERRGEPRIPVGFEIAFRSGLLARRAVLADLSLGGCRLLSRNSLESGRRIRVQVPEALEAGDPISIAGRILRVDKQKDADLDLYVAAIQFDKLERDAREALEVLLEDLANGPATLRRVLAPPKKQEAADGEAIPDSPPAAQRQTGMLVEAPVQLEPVVEASPEGGPTPSSTIIASMPVTPDAPPIDPTPSPLAETTSAEPERRDMKRGVFAGNVPAFGKRALRVLVGRDLSIGGMRIEPLPGLELDDRLHLAIYAEPGEEPFLVWGTVARNDGDGGLALSFDPLEPETTRRLESLVANLPAVESLHDSEAEAMGTVLSEVLPR